MIYERISPLYNLAYWKLFGKEYYSNNATSAINETPVSNANISLMDCVNDESVNSSGIIDTVDMYMKPPAVNGRAQDDASVSMDRKQKH